MGGEERTRCTFLRGGREEETTTEVAWGDEEQD